MFWLSLGFLLWLSSVAAVFGVWMLCTRRPIVGFALILVILSFLAWVYLYSRDRETSLKQNDTRSGSQLP